jgi:glycosyltransferase involved in cell wall biosynthesis
MPNLERTFAALDWARRIVVVDSGSTDGTREWLESRPNVALFQRQFDNHAAQAEFGLQATGIDTAWLLALDADQILSGQLIRELESLDEAASGYESEFTYVVAGRSLRASLYPPRVVLARRDRARFERDGHAHRLTVDGPVARLKGKILHDDRKPRRRFVESQLKYACAEADKLLLTSRSELSASDRVRRAGWIAPWLVPLVYLVGKGGLLDGRAGWIYAGERAVAEWLLAIEILERRLAGPRRAG